MKHRTKTTKFVFSILLLFLASHSAADTENNFLSFAVGHAAVFDLDKIENPTIYKLEYRAKPIKSWWGLAPGLGHSRSEDGSNFSFLYLEKDFNVINHWFASINFGPGFFSDSDEIILGNALEFRSGLRLGYEFNNGSRLALELFHLSNGGISEINPGTEPAFISWTMPLNGFSKLR